MRILLTLLAGVLLHAEFIDGMVATVGRTVVTDSMVRRSLRAAALLAREPLEETESVWRQNRERLIEQALVKEEIRISRYTVAQPDEIRAAMEQIRTQFGGKTAFERKLHEYKLTEADVSENVAWQITFARFIAYRFRPAVQVTDEALRAFYAKWTPAGPKPSLEDAREKVEEEFFAEEASRHLDRWLADVRQQTRIETMEPKGLWP